MTSASYELNLQKAMVYAKLDLLRYCNTLLNAEGAENEAGTFIDKAYEEIVEELELWLKYHNSYFKITEITE